MQLLVGTEVAINRERGGLCIKRPGRLISNYDQESYTYSYYILGVQFLVNNYLTNSKNISIKISANLLALCLGLVDDPEGDHPPHHPGSALMTRGPVF